MLQYAVKCVEVLIHLQAAHARMEPNCTTTSYFHSRFWVGYSDRVAFVEYSASSGLRAGRSEVRIRWRTALGLARKEQKRDSRQNAQEARTSIKEICRRGLRI